MTPITIYEERNEVKIDINTRLYNYNSIITSLKDFSENNWVYLNMDSDLCVSVFLKPKNKDDDINLTNLGYEFYNYILGIMKNGL